MNSWKSSGRTHFFNPLQEKPETPWEAEVDKLADAFTVELDPKKQQDIYYKMQAIYAEQCANLPLWASHIFMASRNTFGNIKATALTDLFWNSEEIYLKDTSGAPAPAVSIPTPEKTPAPASTPEQGATTATEESTKASASKEPETAAPAALIDATTGTTTTAP